MDKVTSFHSVYLIILRIICHEDKIAPAKIADLLHLSLQDWTQIETGETTLTAGMMRRWCYAIDLPFSYFTRLGECYCHWLEELTQTHPRQGPRWSVLHHSLPHQEDNLLQEIVPSDYWKNPPCRMPLMRSSVWQDNDGAFVHRPHPLFKEASGYELNRRIPRPAHRESVEETDSHLDES